MTVSWYKAIRNNKIKRWQTISGDIYKVEICIILSEEVEYENSY